MNAPTEPAFPALRYFMKYLMHHPHEPIIYSRKEFFKLNDIPHQYLFNTVSEEIKELSNNPTSFTRAVPVLGRTKTVPG